jgi:hypothetical protein
MAEYNQKLFRETKYDREKIECWWDTKFVKLNEYTKFKTIKTNIIDNEINTEINIDDVETNIETISMLE